ncbi:hypothetical protein [Mesorhizobium sp. CN2-181]|uniref:hypothetical protein n=1 Tax=Mesorhizobium yinganensis TaxID=3157707 RepID=UPI0032B72AAD
MLAKPDFPPKPLIVPPSKLARTEEALATARAERERLRQESAPLRTYVAATADREATKQVTEFDRQITLAEQKITGLRVERAKLVRDFAPEVDRLLHPFASAQARRLLRALTEANSALAELQSLQAYVVAPHFAASAPHPHKDVSRLMAKMGTVDARPLASLSEWAAEFLPEQERGT